MTRIGTMTRTWERTRTRTEIDNETGLGLEPAEFMS